MKAIFSCLLLAWLCWASPAEALSGGPIEGQVLDYETGKPIGGAIVVALWKSVIVGSGMGTCVHVETAPSDSDGRYAIKEWHDIPSVLVLSAGSSLDVYKQGYESVGAPVVYAGVEPNKWIVYRRDPPNEILQTFPDEASASAATHPNNVYLKPFPGTASSRFDYVWHRVFSGMSCHSNAGASQRNLYPLLKAAYHEAKALAATDRQTKTLRFMRELAASAWLAQPETSARPPDWMATIPDQIRRDLE